MRYDFNILGETPAKKNGKRFVRGNKLICSRKFYEWHSYACGQLLLQKRPKEPIKSPIVLSIIFVHGDKIIRDCDNAASSILDLLKDMEIIQDDNWFIVRELKIRNSYRKSNAHCHIQICSLEESVEDSILDDKTQN